MAVSALGHRVCGIVASARDAIARAGAHQPDVTLMDIRLSGDSSGVDAAREIYACHRLRCIFLSANLDGATRAALSAYVPIAFLGKPFLPIALQRAWKWRRGGLEAARRHNGKLRKVMEAIQVVVQLFAQVVDVFHPLEMGKRSDSRTAGRLRQCGACARENDLVIVTL